MIQYPTEENCYTGLTQLSKCKLGKFKIYIKQFQVHEQYQRLSDRKIYTCTMVHTASNDNLLTIQRLTTDGDTDYKRNL